MLNKKDAQHQIKVETAMNGRNGTRRLTSIGVIEDIANITDDAIPGNKTNRVMIKGKSAVPTHLNLKRIVHKTKDKIRENNS